MFNPISTAAPMLAAIHNRKKGSALRPNENQPARPPEKAYRDLQLTRRGRRAASGEGKAQMEISACVIVDAACSTGRRSSGAWRRKKDISDGAGALFRHAGQFRHAPKSIDLVYP